MTPAGLGPDRHWKYDTLGPQRRGTAAQCRADDALDAIMRKVRRLRWEHTVSGCEITGGNLWDIWERMRRALTR